MNDKIVPAFSFDFLTPFYDFALDIIGFGVKQRIKIVNLLKLKPYERLLDIGCGTGSLLIVAKGRQTIEEELSAILTKLPLQEF